MITATYRRRQQTVEAYQADTWTEIATPRGQHTVAPGDYVVTGEDGVPYVLQQGVFETAYEPVSAAPPPAEPGEMLPPAESPAEAPPTPGPV